MKIKALTQHDIADCARIFLDTYNRAPWNYDWSYEKAVDYLEEYRSSAQFIGFVLYDNDEVAGALLAHSKTWWTNNQLFIDELFVSPNKQKMGVGKLLISHAEEFALDRGLETVTLMTNKFMPAMNFYEKNDYIHAQPFVILFKQLY
jgi:GNAT superfamily N-acetyltransferase